MPRHRSNRFGMSLALTQPPVQLADVPLRTSRHDSPPPNWPLRQRPTSNTGSRPCAAGRNALSRRWHARAAWFPRSWPGAWRSGNRCTSPISNAIVAARITPTPGMLNSHCIASVTSTNSPAAASSCRTWLLTKSNCASNCPLTQRVCSGKRSRCFSSSARPRLPVRITAFARRRSPLGQRRRKTVLQPRALRHQHQSRARQLAQIAQRPRRNPHRGQRAVALQTIQPLRIQLVGLVDLPHHQLGFARMHQLRQQSGLLDLVNNPIPVPGGFHRHGRPRLTSAQIFSHRPRSMLQTDGRCFFRSSGLAGPPRCTACANQTRYTRSCATPFLSGFPTDSVSL